MILLSIIWLIISHDHNHGGFLNVLYCLTISPDAIPFYYHHAEVWEQENVHIVKLEPFLAELENISATLILSHFSSVRSCRSWHFKI